MREDILHILDEVVSEVMHRYRTGRLDSYPEARSKLLLKGASQLENLFHEKLQNIRTHPAFEHMANEIAKQGIPSAYMRDFVIHDRRALDVLQPKEFAWAIRDTGTHLFLPGVGADSCMDWAHAALRSGQNQLWYWWNGTELALIQAAQATQLLAGAEAKLAQEQARIREMVD